MCDLMMRTGPTAHLITQLAITLNIAQAHCSERQRNDKTKMRTPTISANMTIWANQSAVSRIIKQLMIEYKHIIKIETLQYSRSEIFLISSRRSYSRSDLKFNLIFTTFHLFFQFFSLSRCFHIPPLCLLVGIGWLLI